MTTIVATGVFTIPPARMVSCVRLCLSRRDDWAGQIGLPYRTSFLGRIAEGLRAPACCTVRVDSSRLPDRQRMTRSANFDSARSGVREESARAIGPSRDEAAEMGGERTPPVQPATGCRTIRTSCLQQAVGIVQARREIRG